MTGPAINKYRPLVLPAFLSFLILAYWMVTARHASQTGWDFPVFYIPAHLPQSSLYDAKAFAGYWKLHLQSQGVTHWAPYVRLPLFALPLYLLLNLPYYPALLCWIALNSFCYLFALALLFRKLRVSPQVFPIFVAFFPAAGGIITGADIGIYFLLIVLVILFLDSDRQVLAAVAMAGCLCKYNLIALIPVLLAIQRRYRSLFGFIAATTLVIAYTFRVTSLNIYLNAITAAPALAGSFYPVGLRGFTTAIGMPALYPVLAVTVVIISCWLFRKFDLCRSIAVAITGTLMVSPYVTWYDSTLLAFPLLVVYSRSAFSPSGRGIQCFCCLVLAAVPLWVHGGGYAGLAGFMHIAVECLLLAWFVRTVIHESKLPQNHYLFPGSNLTGSNLTGSNLAPARLLT